VKTHTKKNNKFRFAKSNFRTHKLDPSCILSVLCFSVWWVICRFVDRKEFYHLPHLGHFLNPAIGVDSLSYRLNQKSASGNWSYDLNLWWRWRQVL